MFIQFPRSTDFRNHLHSLLQTPAKLCVCSCLTDCFLTEIYDTGNGTVMHRQSILFYLSGEDPRFYKRRVKQYPARLSGGFQSHTEINASATQCSTGALLLMLRHGGSQPCKEEGASHHARRGKNAEAFLKSKTRGGY